jgi:hypothetical protein
MNELQANTKGLFDKLVADGADIRTLLLFALSSYREGWEDGEASIER